MRLLLFCADSDPHFPFDVAPDPDIYLQCCGSGIFNLDPGSGIFIPDRNFSIPDPGLASTN
jgi:hypothetical protein